MPDFMPSRSVEVFLERGDCPPSPTTGRGKGDVAQRRQSLIQGVQDLLGGLLQLLVLLLLRQQDSADITADDLLEQDLLGNALTLPLEI